MTPKTEVETGVEQLGSEGGLATKTVNGPTRGGPQLLMEAQKGVERFNAMNSDGKGRSLCKLHLPNEPLFLHGFVSASQAVDATLSHRHHSRMTQQLLQALKKDIHIGACRPPRMKAGRIEPARLKREGGRRQQGFFRQIDNGLVRRSIEVMGVKIHIRKKKSDHRIRLTSLIEILKSRWSRHRVISAPSPRMAAKNAPHGKPKALKRPVLTDGLNGILRARRRETAGWRRQRRDEALIKAYGRNEQR